MSNGKNQKKQGPRGSRSDVASVRKNAAAAENELRGEREESATQLAQALGAISEGEALAHLDSRLAFIERQVERLNARRDEADRGAQGELAVMRARIEDAMEAVGATAEQQRESLQALEKRLNAIVSETERGSAKVAESLREEIVGKVHETAHRLKKLEARIRGETKAFEQGFDERARTLTQSITDSRGELEQKFEEVSEAFQSHLEETVAGVDRALSEQVGKQTALREEMEEQLDSARARLVEDLTARASEIDSRFEEMSRQAASKVESATETLEKIEAEIQGRLSESWAELDQRATAERAALIERLNTEKSGVQERIAQQGAAIEERITQLETVIDERRTGEQAEILQRLAAERREAEARLMESGAEVRMETQRLREAVESRSKTMAEALEVMRRELLSRIQASEEKAAGSAVRLQSLLDQQKREIVSDEQEWSTMLQEVGDEVSQLKIRIEDLAGRVSTAEARRASERGSSQTNVEGVAARLVALEKKVREAVEEMVAKQGTRLELLHSQVAAITEAEVASEEQVGAVEYLKRRVGEMAERIDEIGVKVNAIGRYVTKPGGPRPAVAQSLPDELVDRITHLEQSLERLAHLEETLERVARREESQGSREAPREPDPLAAEIPERLATLEKAIADLASAVAERREEESQPFAAGAYTPADLSVHVGAPAKPTASTIIPSKRRRW